jgi:hypothetical protein
MLILSKITLPSVTKMTQKYFSLGTLCRFGYFLSVRQNAAPSVFFNLVNKF